MQVVLDMRENELQMRQMEMAKILTILNEQEQEKQKILQAQARNKDEMDALFMQDFLDLSQMESHRGFDIKLNVDIVNQQRKIDNTKAILERKKLEVAEAHRKVEVLKKLKEKQEDQYYKDFLASEVKEIDDITSARFRLE